MAFRWVVLSCAGLVSSVSNVVAAQALTTNTVVHGTLSAPGQVHSYTFSADLDNSVYLSCVESSAGSPVDPRITVLDPSLTLAEQLDGDERPFVTLQADSIGTYTVRIDSLGGGTGDYDLYFVQQPGPSELGALPNGGFRHETIDRGDLDTFGFTASAGESVVLSVVRSQASSSLRPWMWVTNPDGSYAAQILGDVRIVTQFQADQTGDFGLVILDHGGSLVHHPLGDGDYDVYFARIPGANEGGLLANDGAAVPGTIERGDIDSFTLVANQGDAVLLRAAKLGGSVDFVPVLSVYGPSGVLLSGGTDPALATLNAPETGTYTVIVMNADQNTTPTGTGPYSLHLARVPGANEGGALAAGQMGAGSFEAGDLDSYTFTPPLGSTVRLDVSVQPGQVTTTRLYGPDGALLDAKSSTAGASTYSILSQAIATAGIHTIVISGDAGSYNVSWAPLVSQVPLPFWAIPLLAIALFAVGYAASRGARLTGS